MAKGKRVKQKDLDQIKIMRQSGLNVQQVAQIADRGESTIHRAEQANYIFDDYKKLTLSVNQKYRKDETATNGQAKKAVVDTTLVTELQKININLERLVIAWSKKPKESIEK